MVLVRQPAVRQAERAHLQGNQVLEQDVHLRLQHVEPIALIVAYNGAWVLRVLAVDREVHEYEMTEGVSYWASPRVRGELAEVLETLQQPLSLERE